MNDFAKVTLLGLSFTFLLFLGVVFETEKQHREETYEREMKISELEFQLQEATWQIELNNKERGGE
ncbi:hypothetical protein [Jeotgalibaca porci]|uniref:hypothetical protein n=1 Tax=Jeotgalibaca porci TaxID=1868793 RepID=UPI0035A094B5